MAEEINNAERTESDRGQSATEPTPEQVIAYAAALTNKTPRERLDALRNAPKPHGPLTIDTGKPSQGGGLTKIAGEAVGTAPGSGEASVSPMPGGPLKPSDRFDWGIANPPDFKMARAFLATLGTHHTYQTFDDTKDRKLQSLIKVLNSDAGDEVMEKLFNLNADGAGIFVTVNETDGKGRKRGNITRTRTIYGDFDGDDAIALFEAAAAKLPPSMVVASSPTKRHAYWLVSNCTADEGEAMQAKMPEAVGCDPAAKDVTRVLRIPGFYHRKAAPVQTILLENHPERVYDGYEIEAAFGLNLIEAKAKPKAKADRASGTHAGASVGVDYDPLDYAINEHDAALLRSALKTLNASDRDTWIAVGNALCRSGPVGDKLFCEWSATAGKDGGYVDDDDCIDKLRELEPNTHSNYPAIFARAKEKGWVQSEATAEPEPPPHIDFDEAVPGGLTPATRERMNRCIDMTLTLREGGFRDLHGPVRAMQNNAGKVIRQNADGTWQAEGGQPKDAADLLVLGEYGGDAAAAEAEWLVWAADSKQMDWFEGVRDTGGAYSATKLVAFMRNKTGTGGHIGFSFSSTRDLLDSDVNPEWIVKGLVERSTVMAVAGPPKEGKSFVTYDMGMHVAAGLDWGNHKVTQGAVFVIAGEGHGGIARRVKAWHKQHPGHEDAPFFVSKRGALLDTGNEAKDVADVIAAMIDEHGVVPAVVILDTLARNMAGEENSNTDMSRLVKAVDVSFKDRFGFAVLIVHHSTKDGGELLRGASSLKGALDGLIEVRKLKQVPMLVEVITHFLKDGETPGKLTFECERVVIGIDEDMDEITSLVPKLVANTYAGKDGELVPADLSRAMEALRTIDNGQVILLGPAREVLVKAGILKSANPSNQRGDAKDLFDKLVEKGLVRREGATSKSGIVLLPLGWASFDEPPL